MRLFREKKRTTIVETIVKESRNKKEQERRLRKLFCEKLNNPKLLWLLDDTEFLWELVLKFYEQQDKGMLTVNSTWVRSELINELRKRNRLKRIAPTLQLTQEELQMLQEHYDPYDQFEVYDYVSKTYGESWAQFLVSGELTREQLMEKEGISRATFFRKTKEIKETENND